jgi:hypothetical protein
MVKIEMKLEIDSKGFVGSDKVMKTDEPPPLASQGKSNVAKGQEIFLAAEKVKIRHCPQSGIFTVNLSDSRRAFKDDNRNIFKPAFLQQTPEQSNNLAVQDEIIEVGFFPFLDEPGRDGASGKPFFSDEKVEEGIKVVIISHFSENIPVHPCGKRKIIFPAEVGYSSQPTAASQKEDFQAEDAIFLR